MSDCPPEIIDVRRDPAGQLDELLADGAHVHLERLDDRYWHVAVSKHGWRQVFVLAGRVVRCEMDDAPSYAKASEGRPSDPRSPIPDPR